jgi:hypothetical protein
MAPRAAPRSGCPGRLALFVTSSTGNRQWLEEFFKHCPHRQTQLLL